MTQTALCPSCKRDVVFDARDGASWCPLCGARFELAAETKPRRWPRRIHGIIFAGWLFAPAVCALLTYAVLKVMGAHSFDDVFGKQHPTALAWAWLAVSAVSCYAACSWFTGRFTERTVLRVLIGLFLGAGIFLCNIIIAFLGGCAFFPIRFLKLPDRGPPDLL